MVRGWANIDARVEVEVEWNKRSGIEIFPADTSAPPHLMFTPGVSDYQDRYVFGESFRARSDAPEGTTTVTMTVSQAGVGSSTITVDVRVLAPGQLPSRGPGIRFRRIRRWCLRYI